MVTDKDGRPQEDLLIVHCFCICGGDELLVGLLGVARSVERQVLFVLSYSSVFMSVVFMHCVLIRATLISFAIFGF